MASPRVRRAAPERFVGTVRRELLDHVVVMSEDHLRRLLREYIAYYTAERVHTSIGDAPEGRAVQERPSEQAKVVGLPRVGGQACTIDPRGPRLHESRVFSIGPAERADEWWVQTPQSAVVVGVGRAFSSSLSTRVLPRTAQA